MTDALEMFVVYENPKDYPGKFVVRRWSVTPFENGVQLVPDSAAFVGDTLEKVRAAVPASAIRTPHYPGDDPCIVEIWL